MEVTQFGGGVPPVIRGCLTDAWSRDHDRGHDVEMAGDEFLRWQVESKDWGIVSFIRSYIMILVKYIEI